MTLSNCYDFRGPHPCLFHLGCLVGTEHSYSQVVRVFWRSARVTLMRGGGPLRQWVSWVIKTNLTNWTRVSLSLIHSHKSQYFMRLYHLVKGYISKTFSDYNLVCTQTTCGITTPANLSSLHIGRSQCLCHVHGKIWFLIFISCHTYYLNSHIITQYIDDIDGRHLSCTI